MSPHLDRAERERRMTAYLQRCARLIAKHGWMVQGVGGGPGPTFAYTAGLAAKGKPELIVFGLSPNVAQALLNDLAERMVDEGLKVQPGDRIDDLVRPDAFGNPIPVRLLLVQDSTEHLTLANRFATPPVDALQLVFPDVDGLWPWEAESKLHGLPILGLP